MSRVRDHLVAGTQSRAYPGGVPHSAVLPPTRSRARRPRASGLRLKVVGELALGLLLGVVGGWFAGLLRVRRPDQRP